jgi:hypothetical protein
MHLNKPNLDRQGKLRGSGESFSDVIVRLSEMEKSR